ASFAGSGSPPNATILDSNGQDVTSHVSQGSLGGLLAVRNTILPSIQGNGTQQGSLNQLAQQIADRVNAILTAAQTSSGQPGTALFTYAGGNPSAIGQTLAVNPAITAAGLAPASVGPPLVSNGAALQLANLGTSTAPADEVNGQTILQYLSGIAAQAGQS